MAVILFSQKQIPPFHESFDLSIGNRTLQHPKSAIGAEGKLEGAAGISQ
jgi:hypothetical protein